MGRLAAGVAHEIGNPVTGIASLAQNLRAGPLPKIARADIDEILQQTRRIANILGTLMNFSRSGAQARPVSASGCTTASPTPSAWCV